MRQGPVEALLVKISPRFAMVNAVAARAEQLISGDLPAIETNTRNPVLVAMEELAVGKLHLVTKRSPEHAQAPSPAVEFVPAPAGDSAVPEAT